MLAAFAHRTIAGSGGRAKKQFRIMELGCGCGAALLAFSLLWPQCRGFGIDNCADLLEAARANAQNLGMDNLEFGTLNLQPCLPLRNLEQWQRKCLVVMANPPWRGGGNLSKSGRRRMALWRNKGTLAAFCAAASQFLMHRGFFCLILHASLLQEAAIAISATSLGMRLLLPIQSREGQAAERILLLCQQDAAPDLQIEDPLVIHDNTGQDVYTKEAKNFCPWL